MQVVLIIVMTYARVCWCSVLRTFTHMILSQSTKIIVVRVSYFRTALPQLHLHQHPQIRKWIMKFAFSVVGSSKETSDKQATKSSINPIIILR